METHQSSWVLTVGVIKETLLLLHLTHPPKQWQEKGLQVFRRWATHKRLREGFIRLALRLGGVHLFPVFTSQLHSDEGLRVPTPWWLKTWELLLTQSFNALLCPEWKWCRPSIPRSAHVYWQQHHLIISGDQKWCQWLCVSSYEHNGLLRASYHRGHPLHMVERAWLHY